MSFTEACRMGAEIADKAEKSAKTISVSVIQQDNGPTEKLKKRQLWKIDKSMLGFKLHFLLFIGALGFILPYMPLFAKDMVGISATSLGAILTAQQFIFIFSKSIICYLTDYFNKLKATIVILLVVQLVLYFLLLAVPKIDNPQSDPILFKCEAKSEKYIFYKKDVEWLHSIGVSDNLNCIQVMNYYALNNRSKTERGISFESKNIKTFPNATEDERKFYFLSTNVYEDVLVASYKMPKHSCYFFDSNKTLLTFSSAFKECNNILILYFNETLIGYIVKEKLFLSIKAPTSDTDNVQMCSDEAMFNIFPFYSETSIPYYNDSSSHFLSEFLNCDNTTIHESNTAPSHTSVFQTYQFWLFGIIFTCANTCANALFTISDTACCESIKKTGHDFGRQRLFGAIGWGFMAPISGYLIDYTQSYTSAWIVAAVLFTLTFCNLTKLDLVKPHFSQNILKDIGTVLKKKEFLTFLLGVFFNGLGTGVMWFYLVWFITSIGGSRFLCGVVQFVQCTLGEIPFMFFSTWFIKKIGHFSALTLSLLSYCIRFMWYSYLSNPWLILPTEILHGFTYGIFYPTVASYAALSAKPGTEATTQAVLFSTYEGFGAGLGCVLAGLSFDYYGGHWTFFYGSIISGVGMVIHIINTFIVKSHMKNSKVTSDITLSKNKVQK